jgi:hypothetical protein
VLSAFAQRHGVRDMVVVADAGMLSAANLNALEDAGFGFIVGSRITKAPYDLAEHFERHGNYFTNGQVLESARQMGTGKAARVRRVVCQWKFKREQHDNKAINAMIERAEKIADGRAPLKKARFLKVTDITTELDQVTIDRARAPPRRSRPATGRTQRCRLLIRIAATGLPARSATSTSWLSRWVSIPMTASATSASMVMRPMSPSRVTANVGIGLGGVTG